MHVKSTEQFNY